MPIRFPDITSEQLAADLSRKADRTPTVIRSGEVLVIPPGTQELYSQPIQLEGDAMIEVRGDGALIEVS